MKFNLIGSLALFGALANAAPVVNSIGSAEALQARQLNYDDAGNIIATPPLPVAADAEAVKAAEVYASNENKKAMAAKEDAGK